MINTHFSKKRFRVFFIIVSILLTLCLISIISVLYPSRETIKSSAKEFSEDLESKKPKSSATYSYNLTVDNADGTKNWAWAVTQSWCSGTGTIGDPYLINGHTVQFNNSAGGEYACINISNSRNVYFKISNCILRNNASDYGIGISLSNCTNGIIDTITANSNGDDGIYIVNSQNITIEGSILNSNHHYGLNFLNTTVSTISNTTMNLNTLGGGYLINSTYNTFNTNSNFNNNTYGLILIDSDLNNITACHFYNNTNWGIEILDSDQNHIFNSIIEDNLAIGLYIYNETGDSKENLIKGNTFTTNTKNAQDNSTGNHFNSSTTGNTWDDYPGADLDDDGVGDDPYDVPGSAGSKDYLPFFNDGDSIAPTILIILPETNSIHGNSPSFSLTIVEAVGLSKRWYTLTSGSVNITFTGTTGTISSTEWNKFTGLPGQLSSITIIFYANDTTGNLGSASVIIKKFFAPAIEHGEDNDEYITTLMTIILFAVIFIGVFSGIFILSKLITISPKAKTK